MSSLRQQIREAYHMTDPQNTMFLAAQFESMHQDKLRKVPHRSPIWFLYNDGTEGDADRKGLWEEVPQDRIHGMVYKFLEGLYKAADDYDTSQDKEYEDRRKARKIYLRQCMNGIPVSQITAKVGAANLILAKLDDFDADPWKLGMQNGVLDLSGESPVLLDFSPSHMLTKKMQASYDPLHEPKSKHFLKFLDAITRDENGKEDPEYSAWIRRLYGYTISGAANEDVVPLYEGNGINGKSKLMEIVEHTLGKYGALTDIQQIAGESKFQSPNNEFLADLQGLRFAWCDETPQYGAWDPAKFKRLTGSTFLAARKFKPTVRFKSRVVIHLGGQHLPASRDMSEGFWRRVRVLPFRQKFSEVVDRRLLDKLKTDADAVLWWMVQGWQEWRKDGLGSCATVDEATAKYREDEESNTPLGFIREYCEADPANVSDVAMRTTHDDLYSAYLNKFCRDGGASTLKKRGFKAALEMAGYIYARARYMPEAPPADGELPLGYVWHGIRLRREMLEQQAVRWTPNVR